MKAVNVDNARLLNLIGSNGFSQNDFIRLILPLLCKNGVYEFTEDELSKKLYYYRNNPEFRELLQDFAICQTDKKIDISDAMYSAKYFGGYVKWSSLNSQILQLVYPNDFDTTSYEKKLSDDGVQLINRMAHEFGIRNEVERASSHHMNIYGTTPSRRYFLVHGNHGKDIIDFCLLTDGTAKSGIFKSGVEICEDLTNPRRLLALRDGSTKFVEIENASYVAIQGLENGKIKNLKVYTQLLDLYSLQQISEFANKEYEENFMDVKQMVLK